MTKSRSCSRQTTAGVRVKNEELVELATQLEHSKEDVFIWHLFTVLAAIFNISVRWIVVKFTLQTKAIVLPSPLRDKL